uniref:3'5'-cyclic nucleotide phosphodiesterase family protein, related n=1 Tax=Neospora caninum (strain Liverpool) TaxID=572307 RepID=A0A0F7UDV5_NEOCL|nr:TPA: 3'5'-cyclic nucleotide phosphodiesterase family protein, related [Neospora caninum Liverpool]
MSVCQDKTRNRTSSLALCGGLDLARRDPAAMDAENSARLGPDQTVAECDGLPPEEEDDDAQGLSETYTIQSLDILEAILHMETRKHRCRRRLGAVVANIEKQATLFQQLCFKTLKEALVFFLVTRNVRLLNGPKEFVPQVRHRGSLTSHPPQEFNPIIDKRTNFRTRNICCVPLRLGDKVIGCIQLLNKLHGLDFVNEDINFLRSMSDYVSHVFTYTPFIDDRNATLHFGDAWTARALQATISNEPLRSPESNPALFWLSRAIADALDAEHCSLWMTSPGTHSLTLAATTLQKELADDPLPRSAVAERVTEFGASVNIVDAARDIRFEVDSERPSPYATRTMVCIPLMRGAQDADEQPTGCVQLFNKLNGSVFTALDVKKLQVKSKQRACRNQ